MIDPVPEPEVRLVKPQEDFAMLKIRGIAEFKGSFFLGLIVIAATIQAGPDRYLTVPLAHGVGLFIVVAGLGAYSAQFNPAITLAFYFARKVSTWEMIYNLTGQTLGWTLSALILRALYTSDQLNSACPKPANGVEFPNAFLSETIGTFVFASIIFLHRNKPLHDWMVGLSLTAGMWCVFGVSGGALNPDRYLGIVFCQWLFGVNLMDMNALAYVFGTSLGAVLAYAASFSFIGDSGIADLESHFANLNRKE
eukprot:a174414_1966.p2 GENE.a174414_1966~~a174414_1966.p2  ORF type:complete len:262 (+),score=118.25 a174414_1966:32-787(+)